MRAIMNLPNPPAFRYYTKVLANTTKDVCLESMRLAAQEAVELNEGDRDII